jgi:hypothetical protein
MYNNPRILSVKTQILDDFQALCRHCNCQKRYSYSWQSNTKKRYPASMIPSLSVFDIDYSSGTDEILLIV